MSDSTETTEVTERRRSPRVRVLYHVVVTSSGAAEELSVTVGRTVDVSEAGVRIETPGHLSVDDKVRLEIAIEETVVDAKGKVIRAMRVGELIEVGIEFTVISDADRLALVGTS